MEINKTKTNSFFRSQNKWNCYVSLFVFNINYYLLQQIQSNGNLINTCFFFFFKKWNWNLDFRFWISSITGKNRRLSTIVLIYILINIIRYWQQIKSTWFTSLFSCFSSILFFFFFHLELFFFPSRMKLSLFTFKRIYFSFILFLFSMNFV